jgi:hypothetical protein
MTVSPGNNQDIVSGDWLLDERDRYHEAYAGEVVSRSSSGVEWLATREVAEWVVIRQVALRDLPNGENDFAELRFEGSTLAVRYQGHEEQVRPTEDGRYRMGFGWVWQEIDASDAAVVHGISSADRMSQRLARVNPDTTEPPPLTR